MNSKLSVSRCPSLKQTACSWHAEIFNSVLVPCCRASDAYNSFAGAISSWQVCEDRPQRAIRFQEASCLSMSPVQTTCVRSLPGSALPSLSRPWQSSFSSQLEGLRWPSGPKANTSDCVRWVQRHLRPLSQAELWLQRR